ncbi:MAG: spermidine/putrescine ABC transporter substrate-binding protein [Candidatus Improbicoccus pseudotrichonymphae]|uniref:Spermidine/putrescine ABC transporter substrate-binding protein n=1 Tax=Candidatus Improbicoccus pseudotrichonymphae TaxID=3033792 RepID=A0AA48IB24_9FIRM|nr:MAG: spermidine/putrescine ABC transporter substrate-binding protein [Candidatus Improbicoccus pseudotrichonymphae]
MGKYVYKNKFRIIFVLSVLLFAVVFLFLLHFRAQNVVLNVCNWGETVVVDGPNGIKMDINKKFTQETGIKVNYTNFQSNEELYTKLVHGGAKYDVIFPSDYMISKLRKKGIIQKINFDKIPNYKFIDNKHKNLEFDPLNEYSVPYMWGLVGIFYNEKYVKEKKMTWDILWNKKYSGKILYFDNPRDAFGVSLMRIGKNINSKKINDWNEAQRELKKQKPLIQSYVMDQIFDKLNSEEAFLAAFYCHVSTSGITLSPSIKFVIPDEDTNKFVDCACIPKNTSHYEEAHEYINFLCRNDIAFENMKNNGYLSPNTEVEKELSKNSSYFYVKNRDNGKTQVFTDLEDSINENMEKLWLDLKLNENKNSSIDKILFISILFLLMSFNFAKGFKYVLHTVIKNKF